MTKTPDTPAPCAGMGDVHHSHPEEPMEPLSRHARVAVPELVVTCEPCVTECDQSSRGPCSGSHHPDEESICSDSGLSGSPASSLALRKLSNSSSTGLSPASSFEECEEDLMGYGDYNQSPGEPLTVRIRLNTIHFIYVTTIPWIYSVQCQYIKSSILTGNKTVRGENI